MKTKILLIFFALLLVLAPTVASAHGGKNGRGGDEDRSRFELKIENEDEDDEDQLQFEIGEGKFEITGEIESVSGNNFVILGQTITVDPSKVSEFEQKGILAVGNMAKVEGVIIESTKFAREIKVLGTGQGRFKFEIKGVQFSQQPSPSPLPSPSPSPSPTSDITASPSPSPSPVPSATPSANVAVKIKASGPIDQVIEFINQILSFLENLI